MEEVLLVASIVLFLASLLLPTISFFLIHATRKRLAKVERDLVKRETELRYLYELNKKPAAQVPLREPVREPVREEPIVEPPTAPSRPAEEGPPHFRGPEPIKHPAPNYQPPKLVFEAEEPTKPPPAPQVPLEQRLATLFTRVGAAEGAVREADREHYPEG